MFGICKHYQVQCLVQLEYYAEALAIIEMVVKQNAPCSILWYIMGSDVCFLQGNHAEALAWLNRGNELTPDENQEEEIELRKRLAFEKLASCNNTTVIVQNPEKRIDFLQTLPYDLVSAIFQQLPFECLVQCTWVSSHWHAYLVNSLHLWQDLEFSYNDMPVEPSALRLYLSRLDGAPLKRIKIHHECVDGDGLLTELVEHQRLRLQELDLSELICTPAIFYKLLTNVGSTLRVLRWRGLVLKLGNIIDRVAESCIQLQQLQVRSCFVSEKPYDETSALDNPRGGYLPKSFFDQVSALKPLSIRRLALSGIHELTMTQLARILCRSPNLIDLELENCILDIVPVASVLGYSCPMLQSLRYSRHRYAQHAAVLPLMKHVMTEWRQRSWRHLVITKAPTTTNALVQALLHRADLTRLERIDLTGNTGLSDEALQGVVINKWMHLRTLRLAGCTGFTEQTLLDVVKACPMVLHIDLSGIPTVTDAVVDLIAKECKQLQTLNLDECISISDQPVRRLVTALGDTLDELHVNNASISVETAGYIMSKIKLEKKGSRN
ncbi:hypothetical protein BJV82DRAFT_616541 [Fennellomyces sp. T-0311]|nr:hypothetical protein BJV82DRAFT_616541 [Fennellomyces sp. T-0311]